MSDIEAPRLGETVHYVTGKDEQDENGEGMSRGEEAPLLVIKAKAHPIYKDRYEIEGIVTTLVGHHRVKCYDDQECKLPGSWHRDEDCLVEVWKPQE